MIRAKEKKERALGVRLGLKGDRCNSPKCAAVRKPYRPGMHGHKRQRKAVSEFGKQIMEKQKFKLSYGIDEGSLRAIFDAASKRAGSTSEGIIELLERRLDNVVYRLGLAVSRSAAHQMVRHGHIEVNGVRSKSSGLLVKKGDVITIRESSRGTAMFKDLPERLQKYEAPEWLALDPVKLQGTVLQLPTGVDMPFEVSLLVESFSK